VFKGVFEILIFMFDVEEFMLGASRKIQKMTYITLLNQKNKNYVMRCALFQMSNLM